MNQPVLSERALRDLDEIWNFIAQSHPLNADGFVGQLLAVAGRIGETPRMGRLRSPVRKGLRVFPHDNYLILYTIVGERVRILRIVHGSRNIAEILRQGID